jgi:hypothetical protein
MEILPPFGIINLNIYSQDCPTGENYSLPDLEKTL